MPQIVTKTKTYVFSRKAPLVRAGEVLPVPPEMVPSVWKHVDSVFAKIPEYDVERLHARLLIGRDKLWLVVQTAGVPTGWTYMGVILTTITARPPTSQKRFKRSDPAQMRSLTVHLAGGIGIEGWIQSAVERITAYGKEQCCRQLFLLAKQAWRRNAMRFYSRDWDTVAYSRDRRTEAKWRGGTLCNRVGVYRVVVPVRELKKQHYNSGTFCYFAEGMKEAEV